MNIRNRSHIICKLGRFCMGNVIADQSGSSLTIEDEQKSLIHIPSHDLREKSVALTGIGLTCVVDRAMPFIVHRMHLNSLFVFLP
jgi:hypothetical protein